MYYYFAKYSKIGVFFIRDQPDNTNQWDLFINGLFLGTFITPELAADAVYKRRTNYDEWDNIKPDRKIPHKLSEWKRVEDNYLIIQK